MSNILVTQASLPGYREYIEEIRDIWESHWLTNRGEKHERLREELGRYLGTQRLELTVNGHHALELAIQALGLRGEVITTPFTFVSTVSAICRSGLRPVFCDIDPDDYTIDANRIEELITKDTCAILPVHVYGNMCDVDKIGEIASTHGLKVIYDAAHAFGVRYRGAGIGSYGDVSCFSFHATKVFNTIEGGAVCGKDAETFARIATLLDFGIDGEDVTELGTNAKMNEFSAAMGLCNLRQVDALIHLRKEKYELYHRLLDHIPGLRMNRIKNGVTSNYSYLPLLVDEKLYGHNRDELCAMLKNHGIFARKYFWPAVNNMKHYKQSCTHGSTPVSDDISSRILTLPLYPALADMDIERISNLIIAYAEPQR